MIVDLHSHYPMHLLAGEHDTLPAMLRGGRASLADRLRAAALRLANRLDNYPGAGKAPAVTLESLATSDVRVALSMLYIPFDEIDIGVDYGAPPRASYFQDLLKQIKQVEDEIDAQPTKRVVVAHNHDELAAAQIARQVALIHAVEGGFAMGGNEREIKDNVATLASHGVAYITVAHLFYRQVATNAPALPFLSDSIYGALFPQPRVGLTQSGTWLIEAMVDNHILIDVTHMSARSIDDTLQLLARLDPHGDVPLIATHSACKAFGGVQYNIADEHIVEIARRHGVVGLIACEHWMAQGLRKSSTLADSVDIICRHIDHIHTVSNEPAGVHQFAAFGSDQDGFIKPALKGLDGPAGFTELETTLVGRYGAAAAEQICSGNALRVLNYWKGR